MHSLFTALSLLALVNFVLLPHHAHADFLATRNHHDAVAHRRRSPEAESRTASNITIPVEKRGGGPSKFTAFTPDLGACGVWNTNSDFIVALNAPDWDNGAHCFKMITIEYGGKSVQAQITDECPGCPHLGLDLTYSLFSHLADLDLGIIYGSWSYNDGDDNGSGVKKPAPPPPPSHSPSSEHPKPTPRSSTTTTPTRSTHIPSAQPSSQSNTSTSTSTPTSAAPATVTTLSAGDPQVLNQVNVAMIQLGGLVLSGAQQA